MVETCCDFNKINWMLYILCVALNGTWKLSSNKFKTPKTISGLQKEKNDIRLLIFTERLVASF
jgi:hypothetical protein